MRIDRLDAEPRLAGESDTRRRFPGAPRLALGFQDSRRDDGLYGPLELMLLGFEVGIPFSRSHGGLRWSQRFSDRSSIDTLALIFSLLDERTLEGMKFVG